MKVGWLVLNARTHEGEWGIEGKHRTPTDEQMRKHREKHTSREMEKGLKLATNIPTGKPTTLDFHCK